MARNDPPTVRPTANTQERAAWVFGALFVVFIALVFIFGPATLPTYKHQILAFFGSLLAGLFALFFTGRLLLNADLPLAGKWGVQAGAGFALFLVVLFWWKTPSIAPIAEQPATAAP